MVSGVGNISSQFLLPCRALALSERKNTSKPACVYLTELFFAQTADVNFYFCASLWRIFSSNTPPFLSFFIGWLFPLWATSGCKTRCLPFIWLSIRTQIQRTLWLCRIVQAEAWRNHVEGQRNSEALINQTAGDWLFRKLDFCSFQLQQSWTNDAATIWGTLIKVLVL